MGVISFMTRQPPSSHLKRARKEEGIGFSIRGKNRHTSNVINGVINNDIKAFLAVVLLDLCWGELFGHLDFFDASSL